MIPRREWLIGASLLASRPAAAWMHGNTFPGDTTGTQAARLADMLERFGANIYPMDSFPGTNVFGANPSCNYSVAGIVAAHDYIVGTSGLSLLHRLWTWQAANSPFLDLDTLAATLAKNVNCRYTMTTGGAPSNTDSIPWATNAAIAAWNGTSPWTGAAAQSVIFVEGYNEPNNLGGETAAQTAAGQGEIATALASYPLIGNVSSSVTFGLPVPEGYITGFMGSSMSSFASHSGLWNAHFYPPTNPDIDDGSNRGGAFNDVHQGLNTAYGKTGPQIITEWHPTLYASSAPTVCDPAHDAYYAVLFILSAFRLGYQGYVWWSLLDFNDTAPSSGGFAGTGLWAHDATVDTPRATANTLRALYTLTGDVGANKHTFAPSMLNYTVSGLPAPTSGSPNTGGQTMLLQNSAGTFFLFVWNSQATPGGSAVNVTITFLSHVMTRVEDYKITDISSQSAPTTQLQNLTNATAITVSLDASVHLLRITY